MLASKNRYHKIYYTFRGLKYFGDIEGLSVSIENYINYDNTTKKIDLKIGDLVSFRATVMSYNIFYNKYATEKYGIDVNDVICRVEYLKTNTVKEFTFSKEDIEQISYAILGSVSSMMELLDNPELNKAKSVENFSKCNDKEKCKYCNFRKVCN